jgi:hypothetical protein
MLTMIGGLRRSCAGLCLNIMLAARQMPISGITTGKIARLRSMNG